MFSLSSTELVFEKRSKSSLQRESILLKLLSSKIIGLLLINISILFKKLKILNKFPGNLIIRWYYCKSSADEFKKVSNENFQNGINTCISPLSCGHNSINELINSLQNNLFDAPGLSFIFLNVDNYIDNRILNLVSNDGLLNQADKKTFQQFNDNIEAIGELAHHKKQSVILYTPNLSGFPALHALAVDLMRRFNANEPTIFLLFHLCHANSQMRITEIVREASRQGFIPGIAIAKYLTSDYSFNNTAEKNSSESTFNSFIQTKRVFYEVTKFLLNNIDNVSAFIITHNPDNILYLTSLMGNSQVGNNNKNIILAQRYGMARHISYNLATRGYNTAVIVPYGNFEDALHWMGKIYRYDPSLPSIFAEHRYAILRELNRRKLEN